MTATEAAARAYLLAGLSVIPVRCDGTKAPAEAGWRQFAERCPTADEVGAWFGPGARHQYGIGIVGGAASGNLAVLDFETDDAYVRWLKALPKDAEQRTRRCPLVRTGGGGVHLYARLPELVPGTVLARRKCGDESKVLIEIRGNGQQVVAPGSPAECHKTGKLYEWLREGWTVAGTTWAEVPLEVWLQWCFTAEELNELPRAVASEEARTVPPAARGRVEGDVRPGDDFNVRGTWAETGLFDSWVWHRELDSDRGFVRRPGKRKDEGLSGTVGMVTARQGGWPLFYCFTSNGAPFDANAAYSRFRTYAILKHGGDWSAATRALGEAGYGSAPRKGASGVTFSLPGTVQQADGAQPKPEKYQFIDSAEFRRKDYRVDWFVDWFLARGQPGVVAGPSKGMKTSTLVDLAVSVATGTPHMGKWNVPRRAKVALVSGESGGYTLQETFLRVLRSRNLTEDACDGWLKWEFCLPTFADLIDTEDFASKLGALGCELVVIDPFYLTLGAVDAKNMFEMGQVLRTVSELLLARHGVTPLIAHHANRLLPIGEPMELQHLAYSGLEQFARQYVFINRRSAYENDGRHELWYRYGGSAGHSGLYAVSIDEGVLGPDTPHRRWDVSVNTQGETRVKDEREKRQERRVASSTAAQVDDEAVMLAIDAECAKFAGATKTRIREASGLTQPRANAAVERLQEAGVIERVTFKKTGGRGAEQEVEGYKRADGSINYG